MKKAIAFLLSASLILSLTACGGKDSQAAPGELENIQIGAEDIGAPQAGSSQADAPGAAVSDSTTGGTGGLRFLTSENMEGCHTKDGYYYQTFETEKLSDGSYGSHLMYMDFQALQEVYLCSNAGYSHDSPDCTAVLPYDDFPASTLLFVWQDSLYLLSKMSDNDGSMQMSFGEGDSGSSSSGTEGSAAVLYRANLDGTGREAVHAFDPSLSLEDFVLGDESGIYVVTKKLTAEQGSEGTYINSAQRKLVRLDLASGKEQEVCSLDFDGFISWRLVDCYDRTLVLQGTDYGREISNDELFSDDAYKDLYENSQTVYATVALDSPEPEIRYRQDNKDRNYAQVEGNMLYAGKGE